MADNSDTKESLETEDLERGLNDVGLALQSYEEDE